MLQCYLPPGRDDIPAFTPAETGTRLTAPQRCKAELVFVELTSLSLLSK